jgi:hypothetical protein
MLTGLVVVFRSLALICCGHRAVAFENVALRQQLAVFRRTVKRPQFRNGDRLFWVLFSKAWQDWRTALVVVHPTRWCAGIASGSDADGRNALRTPVPVARARMRPFERSLARWAPRIRCGERLGFTEN